MLFENQETFYAGTRQYGAHQHLHYVSKSAGDSITYHGARMVHSTTTEMMANVRIHQAGFAGSHEFSYPSTLSENGFALGPSLPAP